MAKDKKWDLTVNKFVVIKVLSDLANFFSSKDSSLFLIFVRFIY